MILVVAEESDTLRKLLPLAIPCARSKNRPLLLFHLERSPSGGQEETFTEPPAWLRKLARSAEKAGVETRILAGRSRSPARTVRETVRRSNVELVILGWKGQDSPKAKKPRGLLASLLSDPPCNVAVARLNRGKSRFKRILLPTAGGPNARLAADIAYALASEAGGRVDVLYVLRPGADRAQRLLAEETIAHTAGPLAQTPEFSPLVVEAPSPLEGILTEAESRDLVLIGASREGVITRVLFGEIPLKVVRESTTPVVIVKQAPGPALYLARRGWDRLLALFPSLSEEEKIATYREVRRGARPDTDFFFMMGLSAAIASLGLLLNSPAVIIGAMLVAPLMSAVIGLGLGVVQGDLRFLKVALAALMRGVALAVAVGWLAGLLSPVRELTSEMAARGHPTLLDLGVALASGMAGAYALSRKEFSAALPGVAIAAALIPPLTTAGLSLSMLRWDVALGAMLLFLTNLVAIAVGGGAVFLLLGFGPEADKKSRVQVFTGGIRSLGILLAVILVVLGVLSYGSFRERRYATLARQVVAREVASWDADAEVLEVETRLQKDGSALVLAEVRCVETVDEAALSRMQQELSSALKRRVRIRVSIRRCVESGTAR